MVSSPWLLQFESQAGDPVSAAGVRPVWCSTGGKLCLRGGAEQPV